MHWNLDDRTLRAATKYPIPIKRTSPIGPFNGRNFNTRSWNHRVIQPATWNGELRSDPDQIMRQFRNHRYTQGLAMVVSWGTMWRQPDAIWGDRKLESIEGALRCCAESVVKTESVEDSWKLLRTQLWWSSVLISKTLHFICRSLGVEDAPAVPIDGAVIRQRVWPAFRDSIPYHERPESWDGDSFEAYSRYMTAILTWAKNKRWSSSEIERTISLQFQPDWNRFCA
ncbi:MAG: hypothetical protein JWN74_1113 [Acidobacteriaceae bacterium]|nr:hypothetical protein [Acidobacteriaceae bacterium]